MQVFFYNFILLFKNHCDKYFVNKSHITYYVIEKDRKAVFNFNTKEATAC